MPIPGDATALFTATDLADWLHKPVTDAAAEAAERVVWGWLRPILGIETRPETQAPELTSAAIELGGIAHENPAGLSSKQVGPFQEQYSSERRDAILASVGNGFQPATAPPAPRGRFPSARRYPDAAEPC